ncbi:MAG: response regulator, partial [bacterium]
PETEELPMTRILLVDDDLLVLNTITDMLLMKGYNVTAVREGKKALQLLTDDGRYDLVLTDLRMPDVDDFEIAKATKAKNSEIPVILYSGWAADYEDEDLTRKAVDVLLKKPELDPNV